MGKELIVNTTEETFADAHDITEGLNNIIRRAEDAPHLEEILNNATTAFYLMIPGGAENYSGTSPKLGKVHLVGGPYPASEGKITLMFTPSIQYQKKWGSEFKAIGKIDLRKKEYSTAWGTVYDEHFHHIPQQVMEDTETVMEMLGLTNPIKEKAQHPF